MPVYGTICLLNRIAEPVDEKSYNSRWARNKIIERWKKRYGGMFCYCLLQIKPTCNYQMVNKDGTNRKRITERSYDKEKSYLTSKSVSVVRKGRHISPDTHSMYDFQH